MDKVLENYHIGWAGFNKNKEKSQELINYLNNRSEILVEKGIIYYQIMRRYPGYRGYLNYLIIFR